MSKFTISESSNTPIEPGEYIAVHKGIEGPTEGEHGEYYTFIFENEEREYRGFASVPKTISVSNKLGRWLCALAGKKPQVMAVDTELYIGKRYKLIYAAGKEGKSSLNTFALLP